MKFNNVLDNFLNVLLNLKRMFLFAWKTDSKVTFGYYLTGGIGALTPLAASFLLKYLIDNLSSSENFAGNIPMLIILILGSLYIVDLIGDIVLWSLNRVYFDYLFRYKLENAIDLTFHNKLAELDVAHLEDPEIQNMITKAKDTVSWRLPDFMRMFSYFFSNLVEMVAAFIILSSFSIWVPIVLTLVALPRLLLRVKFGSIQWSTYSSGVPEVKKLWYIRGLLSTNTALREMKIFQSKNALIDKFKSTQDFLFHKNKKPLEDYLKVLNLPILLDTSVLFIISYLFLPNVLGGIITVGSYILFINILRQFSGARNGVIWNFGEVYEHNSYVNHFFDILNLEKIVKEKDNPVSLEKIAPPKIEFKNVYFDYPNGASVLKNVSFIINPGESVAFVGQNGAGKTTIIKLLCRFYDVTKGEILINDINIKDLKINNWYKFLGTLFQDFVQYHFTVKENILLGQPEKFDETAIKDAAVKAGADEFIQNLPNKYDQILGREFEGGEELSIGQWQKLSMARAFYEEAPVLILDEPTSAIDAESEYQIFTNLEKTYKNRTLIFVSHRFSTVRNANRIFVIDNGEIIEQGSHKHLINLKGKYEKMFKIQAKGYER